MRQISLFAEETSSENLSKLGDCLERLNIIDREMFRPELKKSEAIDTLFKIFYNRIESGGIITHTGTLAGAAFADATRQRNSREENKKVKDGEIPEEWRENKAKSVGVNGSDR